MRFLLTNDDGWDDEGLKLLRQVAEEYGEVYIVAPLENQTGVGHQVTVRQPMATRRIEPRLLAVGGTPADCVRVGLNWWPVEFDWVLSGINNGANMGVDIFSSGTVAAREATFQGVHAVALSQYREDWNRPVSRSAVLSHVRRLVGEITQRQGSPSERAPDSRTHPRVSAAHLVNINLPDFGPDGDGEQASVEVCELDLSPLPAEFEQTSEGLIYRGRYRDRARVPGRDVDVCLSGNVALTYL